MALATRPKPKHPDKKRRAQHHKHSPHYLKAYWPYIPMLMVVGLGLTINTLWTSSGVLGAHSDYSDSSLLADTNAERVSNAESSLSIDPLLTKAATAKAADMVARNYWSHDTPDGKTPWTFLASSGYQYQLAGENLAYGFSDAEGTITGWMNSPEHRANLLNAGYSQVGFGVATSPNYQGKGPETVVVAMYAEPADAAANIQFTVPNAPEVLPANTHTVSQPPARLVSRVQLLTNGQAPWSLAAVSAIGGFALALFLVRHGLRLRKLAIKGEAYVAHHPVLDFAIVTVFTIGFVLTRTSGFIR